MLMVIFTCNIKDFKRLQDYKLRICFFDILEQYLSAVSKIPQTKVTFQTGHSRIF